MCRYNFESFEDREDDGEGKDREEDAGQEETDSKDSLMEGWIGAYAAKGELRMLDTIGAMDQSGTERLAANDQSIRGLLDERRNIYKLTSDPDTSIKEKISAMSDYVATLASQGKMEEHFKQRIDVGSDGDARERLKAMLDYFMDLDMGNGVESLAKDRAHALQERINARDLRTAHLGDRHLVMAGQQKKELQSLFDEDDIMRAQGQDSITNRTGDIAERLQDKLDGRNHIDGTAILDEKVREEEERREEALEKEKLEKENDDKNSAADNADIIHAPDEGRA